MNAPAVAAPMQKSAAEYRQIPVIEIKPSATPMQVIRRAHYDADKLAELAADIKAHGVMEPVLLRCLQPAHGKLNYEIVAGERRFLAAQQAGLTTIPALVSAIPEAYAEEMQIAENLQRENLHVLEEAEGYQRLCAIHKCAAKDLVARVNRNEAHIYARLKLLALAPPVKEAFYAGKIRNASIALEIARIPDPKLQQKAAAAKSAWRSTSVWPRSKPCARNIPSNSARPSCWN